MGALTVSQNARAEQGACAGPNDFADGCLSLGTMMPTQQPGARPRQASADKTTRWIVIGFAIVEAALLAWALLSGIR